MGSPDLFVSLSPVATLILIVFSALCYLHVSFTDLLVKDGPAQLVRAARAQDLTSTTLVTVALMKLKRDIITSLLC